MPKILILKSIKRTHKNNYLSNFIENCILYDRALPCDRDVIFFFWNASLTDSFDTAKREDPTLLSQRFFLSVMTCAIVSQH